MQALRPNLKQSAATQPSITFLAKRQIRHIRLTFAGEHPAGLLVPWDVPFRGTFRIIQGEIDPSFVVTHTGGLEVARPIQEVSGSTRRLH